MQGTERAHRALGADWMMAVMTAVRSALSRSPAHPWTTTHIAHHSTATSTFKRHTTFACNNVACNFACSPHTLIRLHGLLPGLADCGPPGLATFEVREPSIAAFVHANNYSNVTGLWCRYRRPGFEYGWGWSTGPFDPHMKPPLPTPQTILLLTSSFILLTF